MKKAFFKNKTCPNCAFIARDNGAHNYKNLKSENERKEIKNCNFSFLENTNSPLLACVLGRWYMGNNKTRAKINNLKTWTCHNFFHYKKATDVPFEIIKEDQKHRIAKNRFQIIILITLLTALMGLLAKNF